MAEDDELFSERELMDPNLSMVVIRESRIFSKEEDLVVFPPMNHENLQVGGSIYLESPSESASPSSSSRRSGSSSSFSLLPSDSDGQIEKSPSETEEKSQPSIDDKSPPSDSACGFDRKLYRETEVLQYWWELVLVRVCSKFKSFLTWFSTTLTTFYPVLAIAIWWWIRARRRRINEDRLRDTIKEKDERIVKLLNQIAQMNELLVSHHKDIVSRR